MLQLFQEFTIILDMTDFALYLSLKLNLYYTGSYILRVSCYNILTDLWTTEPLVAVGSVEICPYAPGMYDG